MTEDGMTPLGLAEKHGDGEFLKDLGRWTLRRHMESEPDERLNNRRE